VPGVLKVLWHDLRLHLLPVIIPLTEVSAAAAATAAVTAAAAAAAGAAAAAAAAAG
jgi:hypothetical protein